MMLRVAAVAGKGGRPVVGTVVHEIGLSIKSRLTLTVPIIIITSSSPSSLSSQVVAGAYNKIYRS